MESELWHLENDDEIFPGLKLRYYYLPSPLKRCFQYFSLFPVDVFAKDDLVYMWIAEGFVEAEKCQSLEDVVFQYYSELKGRSLVQENKTMHDLIHSLACIISRKFFYPVKIRHSNSCKLLSSYRHVSLDGDYLFEASKLELRATAESLRTKSLLRCFAGGSSVELPFWK